MSRVRYEWENWYVTGFILTTYRLWTASSIFYILYKNNINNNGLNTVFLQRSEERAKLGWTEYVGEVLVVLYNVTVVGDVVLHVNFHVLFVVSVIPSSTCASTISSEVHFVSSPLPLPWPFQIYTVIWKGNQPFITCQFALFIILIFFFDSFPSLFIFFLK